MNIKTAKKIAKWIFILSFILSLAWNGSASILSVVGVSIIAVFFTAIVARIQDVSLASKMPETVEKFQSVNWTQLLIKIFLLSFGEALIIALIVYGFFYYVFGDR